MAAERSAGFTSTKLSRGALTGLVGASLDNRRMSSRHALLAAPLLLLVLAGCVETPSDGNIPTPTSTETAGYTPPPSSSPTPTASATADATSEPVTLACSDLVSADQMYEYNLNFGLIDGWAPSPGTFAGDAVAAQGVACRWQNQSSGATIDIAVAHLLGTRLTDAEAAAKASSTAVDDYGVEGYFFANGGPGVAQAFTGEYWITAQSTTFFGAGDVSPLMEYILPALG